MQKFQSIFILLLLATPLGAQELYWTDYGAQKLQSYSVQDGKVRDLLVNPVDFPFDLAADAAAGKAYWVEYQLKEIRRANFNGSGLETIYRAENGNLYEIALDRARGKIYWSNPGAQSIERANLDGSGVETVFHGQACVGLALDSQNEWLYFTASSDHGQGEIRRIKLDGSILELLYTTPQTPQPSAPSRIAIDTLHQRIYWIQYPTGTIYRSDLDKFNPTLVVNFQNGFFAADIAVDPAAGRLFWTEGWVDWYAATKSADLDGLNVQSLGIGGMWSAWGIDVDTTSQRVYVWQNFVAEFGLASAAYDGSEKEEHLHSQLQNPKGVAFDFTNNKVLWIESTSSLYGGILRLNPDGTNNESLLAVDGPPNQIGAGFADQIAVDWENGKMYWSANFNIRRANLDGSQVQSIANPSTGLHSTRGVALDLQAGKVYWSEYRLGSPLPADRIIRRANLDGTQKETFLTLADGISSASYLTIDPYERALYWTGALSSGGRIQRANLDGSPDLQDVVTGLYGASGIAIDGLARKIYWADLGSNVTPNDNDSRIRRANLDGSQIEDLVVGLSFPQGLALYYDPGILNSFPHSCAIDARQPHPLNNPAPSSGWQSIDLFFNRPVPELSIFDIQLAEISGSGSVPQFTSIQNLSPSKWRLEWNEPIEVGAWTCLEHPESGSRACLGYLPGDVNGDGTSSPLDILKIIDGLNSAANPPLAIWQTDIDRSGHFNPGDVLRVIDLLIGADAFVPWLSQSLPPCP